MGWLTVNYLLMTFFPKYFECELPGRYWKGFELLPVPLVPLYLLFYIKNTNEMRNNFTLISSFNVKASSCPDRLWCIYCLVWIDFVQRAAAQTPTDFKYIEQFGKGLYCNHGEGQKKLVFFFMCQKQEIQWLETRWWGVAQSHSRDIKLPPVKYRLTKSSVVINEKMDHWARIRPTKSLPLRQKMRQVGQRVSVLHL